MWTSEERSVGDHPWRLRSVRRPVFMVLGAPQDTGNLGVSALGISAVKGLRTAFPDAEIFIERHKAADRVCLQMRNGDIELEPVRIYPWKQFRARYGTRRVGALLQIARRLPARLGDWLVRSNITASQLACTDVVIDMAAGDGFADIYGGLERQVAIKQFILDLGKPLVLAPQTLGPFYNEESRSVARCVLKRVLLAATREFGGRVEAATELGADVAERIVVHPDVAFLLDPIPVSPDLEPFAMASPTAGPLIGLNISGLFYCQEGPVQIAAPYRELTARLGHWALSKPNARLLLVPHVIGTAPLPRERSQWPSNVENDTIACRLVMDEFKTKYGDRVGCVGWPRTAGETKYLIGRCDFFIGARMHACIAGVSQALPTVSLAYSKKVAGVMGHLGITDAVIDLREETVDSCLQKVERLFQQRLELRARLQASLPAVVRSAQDFFSVSLRQAVSRLIAKAR